MPVLTYVFRLMPTRAQHAALAEILENQRLLYNAALQERRDAWRRGVSIGMNDQTKSLTDIRSFDDAYGGVPYNVSKWTLKRLDDAMKAFFRRAKARRGKAGFPRFRSRSRWLSFGFHQRDGLRVREDRLLFSGGLVGGLRMKMHRSLPENGVVKSAVFNRELGIWRVAIAIEVEVMAQAGEDTFDAIDVGVEFLATTANGVHFENVRPRSRGAQALRRAARALARARRGSARRRKTRERLQRIQRQVKNARRTHLHAVSRQLAGIATTIFVEDLSLKNMTRSARGTAEKPGTNVRQKSGLNRALADAAPARLISMLTYKAESAGREVIKVDPRGTSQTCPACGSPAPKALSDRWHSCACGAELHRDHAAALNILKRGLEMISSAAPGAARRPGELNVAGCGVRAPGNTDQLAACAA